MKRRRKRRKRRSEGTGDHTGRSGSHFILGRGGITDAGNGEIRDDMVWASSVPDPVPLGASGTGLFLKKLRRPLWVEPSVVMAAVNKSDGIASPPTYEALSPLKSSAVPYLVCSRSSISPVPSHTLHCL